MFFPRRPSESAADFLAPLCDVSVEQMEAALKNMDDLDLVELVMEVEETLRSGQRSLKQAEPDAAPNGTSTMIHV
jgi:hypothetical protein